VVFLLVEHSLNCLLFFSLLQWKNNFITYWMDENKNFEILSETGTLIQKGDLREQEKDHFTFYVSFKNMLSNLF